MKLRRILRKIDNEESNKCIPHHSKNSEKYIKDIPYHGKPLMVRRKSLAVRCKKCNRYISHHESWIAQARKMGLCDKCYYRHTWKW